jgi:hypothetical protein
MALWEKADADVQAQKAAEAALRAKRRDRDSLVERLGIAEAAIASYRAQARQLAADGADDKAISVAEGKMRDAQDRCVTLTGAIGDVDKIIIGLEREIDQIVDKRCRAETSVAVTAMADRLAKAQVAHKAAALELELAAKEGGILIPESVAVYQFTRSAREQLPPAVEMVVAALRAHSRGVLSGHGSPSLPQQPAPPPKLGIVPPPPPTLTLFTTKKLKYLDAAGAVIVCGAYHKHAFPQALGELAIRTNVAVALDDKRVRDLQAAGFATVGTPDENACVWLGPKGREAPERFAKPGGPAIHSSLTSFTPSGAGPFTVVDRGPPITGTMPARPIEAMAATRKAEDES